MFEACCERDGCGLIHGHESCHVLHSYGGFIDAGGRLWTCSSRPWATGAMAVVLTPTVVASTLKMNGPVPSCALVT